MASRGFGALLAQVLRALTAPRESAPGRATPGRTRAPQAPRHTPARPGPPGAGRRPAPAGGLEMDYSPRADGRPDPGEIVWGWVPFEEDDGRGKDRPVLVVARSGADLVALMLTSKDHDRDAADEARHGRHWIDIGSGAWDRQGRPSEVRVDRLITLDPDAVRREGATLDRARFDRVVAEVRSVHGW